MNCKFTRVFLTNVILTCIVLCFARCSTDSKEEIPNPEPLSDQFQEIQLALVDAYGDYYSKYNSIIDGQILGVARSWNSFVGYGWLSRPESFNPVWNIVFEEILKPLSSIKSQAKSEGAHHYEGMINITQAYALMVATDVWDALPYQDIEISTNNIDIRYVPQAILYDHINELIDEGIKKLEGPIGALPPESQDLFYAGDALLWIKAAYAIKARGMIHWGNYEEAISNALQSFTNSEDNFGYQYPGNNSPAPWYQYNEKRVGEFYLGNDIRDLMQELNDIDRLYVIDIEFKGSGGEIDSNPFLRSDSFVELISYREIQFVMAEAYFRMGMTDKAHIAYLNGILAAFQKYGLTDAAYSSYVQQTLIDPGVGNLTFEHIMVQKYIAMYLDPEAFSDIRRTHIPSVTPHAGLSVPVRWPISEQEMSSNPNAPLEGTIDIFRDRVEWDRE